MNQSKMTRKEFEKIKVLVKKNIGITLKDSKKALVISRFSKRLRELELDSFNEYIKYLRSHPEELEIMVNNITTNVTHFYRESAHFDYLKEVLLPEIKNNKKKKNIRGWSAACSTGEEPYTIGLVVKENLPVSWNIKILASDINTEVLNKARQGIYPTNSVKNIPRELLPKYFLLGEGKNRGLFKVKNTLKQIINFKKINLNNGEEYPNDNSLDFVFCRNVFIYFNKETQEEIISRFEKVLRPGGRLFLGHSEKINLEKFKGWQVVAPTIYKKL